ncbi:MAG: acetyl-CoA carboxylase biotin carboxyl carrier protein [Nitrospiraceae bacterium]|nr:MAG: acetyl-CoA carboxylase biotin carboxyl carrier protein [Nitrospiraceae bacterium]
MKGRPAKPAKKAAKPEPKPRPDALVDPKALQDLITVFQNADVSDLEVERNGLRIRLRREGAGGVSPAEMAVQVYSAGHGVVPTVAPSADESTEGLVTMRSPIVGTFYRSASPYSESYVEEGAYVKKGQVLCIVEAMKLMNEIESEVDGRVVKILLENAKSVEYGEPIFLIEPGAQPEG